MCFKQAVFQAKPGPAHIWTALEAGKNATTERCSKEVRQMCCCKTLASSAMPLLGSLVLMLRLNHAAAVTTLILGWYATSQYAPHLIAWLLAFVFLLPLEPSFLFRLATRGSCTSTTVSTVKSGGSSRRA